MHVPQILHGAGFWWVKCAGSLLPYLHLHRQSRSRENQQASQWIGAQVTAVEGELSVAAGPDRQPVHGLACSGNGLMLAAVFGIPPPPDMAHQYAPPPPLSLSFRAQTEEGEEKREKRTY